MTDGSTHHTGTHPTHNGDPAAVDRSALRKRLEDLRAELAQGEARLREIELERTRVRDTVLRIEGAIVVLQELDGSHRPE